VAPCLGVFVARAACVAGEEACVAEEGEGCGVSCGDALRQNP
jgi:hypothetical protein